MLVFSRDIKVVALVEQKMLPPASETCHCATVEVKAGSLGIGLTSGRVVCISSRIHGSGDGIADTLDWSAAS